MVLHLAFGPILLADWVATSPAASPAGCGSSPRPWPKVLDRPGQTRLLEDARDLLGPGDGGPFGPWATPAGDAESS